MATAPVNMSDLQRRHAELQKKTYKTFGGGDGNREYPFNPTRISNLLPGTYLARTLWTDPIKNPDGTFLVSTVKVQEGDKTHSFLAAESIEPDRAYHGIDQVMEKIEKEGIYKILKANPDTVRLCGPMDDFAPWRRYWIPMYIWMIEQPRANPKEYPKYAAAAPDAMGNWGEPKDVLLEVNFSTKFMAALFEAFKLYPGMCHHQTGFNFWIKIGSNNRYDLEVIPHPAPMTKHMIDHASEHYPEMRKLAEEKFKMYKSPSEIFGILQSQWWWPYYTNIDDGYVDPSGNNLNRDGSIKGMGLVFPPPKQPQLPSIGGNSAPMGGTPPVHVPQVTAPTAQSVPPRVAAAETPTPPGMPPGVPPGVPATHKTGW